MQTVIGLFIGLLIGFLIGVIITTVVHMEGTIGTIHIEPDFEDGGETYRFSFEDFDQVKKSKTVRLNIKDHTH